MTFPPHIYIVIAHNNVLWEDDGIFAGIGQKGLLVDQQSMVFASLGCSLLLFYYMGVHVPFDVIIGGLIGALFALGAWLARKKVLAPPAPLAV